MNVKQPVRSGLQLIIVMTLLIANTSIAAAQGGDDGGDYIGQVSVSITKSLPPPKNGGPGIQPNASQPLPGGGTATATAQLAWNASRMDGNAISKLSSDTPATYSICATAVQLYMDSSPQGGAGQVCAAKTGGGSVKSTKWKAVLSVFGHSWRIDTSHAFTKSGWGGWFPTQSASANL